MTCCVRLEHFGLGKPADCYALAMKRNGLVLAAGIIGIVRGTLGTFVNLGSLPNLKLLEDLFPGMSAMIVFAILLSVTILIVSIWVIVKANDPNSASAIKIWGGLIIAAGVGELVWGIALMGNGGEVMAAGLGGLVGLGLIGGLLVAGGNSLKK